MEGRGWAHPSVVFCELQLGHMATSMCKGAGKQMNCGPRRDRLDLVTTSYHVSVTLLFRDTDFPFTRWSLNQLLYLLFNQKSHLLQCWRKQAVLNFIREHTVLVFNGQFKGPSRINLVPGTNLESGSSGSWNSPYFHQACFPVPAADVGSLPVQPIFMCAI